MLNVSFAKKDAKNSLHPENSKSIWSMIWHQWQHKPLDLNKQSQKGWRKQAFWIENKKQTILINNMSPATSLLRGKQMPFASFTKVCLKSSTSNKITQTSFSYYFFSFLCCLALKPAAGILNFLHRGEFKETNGFSPHERNSLCNKLDLHMHYSKLRCQYKSII